MPESQSARPEGIPEVSRPHMMPLSDLDESHFEPLARAITNVFLTKIAQDTFAQLVDGVPLDKSLGEAHGRPLMDATTHPARQHTVLCPGTLERMEGFKAKFSIQDLELDAKVCLPFHDQMKNADHWAHHR